MFGRQDQEGRTEERVRPGGEHADLVAAGQVRTRSGAEHDLGALRPTDPVGLLDPDRLRPVDPAEVEQLVGVLRDPEEPLLQVALLDERVAAPAAPLRPLDLFARQGAVVGAPVDRRLGPVGQAGLEELEEYPLVPAVVLRRGRDDLRGPLEGGTHRAQLTAHVVDVLHRPDGRVDVVLDGRAFGRQAERIEPDRIEDVEAIHPPVTGDRVGRRLDVPVADVQIAGRVRVHRQQVELGPRRVGQVRLVQPELVPARLPARLDRGGVVPLNPGAVDVADLNGRFGWYGRFALALLDIGHVAPRKRCTPRRGEGWTGSAAGRKHGDDKRWMVEPRGLEPRTSCMPCRRSSN